MENGGGIETRPLLYSRDLLVGALLISRRYHD